MKTKESPGVPPEDLEPLSVIIAGLNERFGLNLGLSQGYTWPDPGEA